MAVVLTSQSVDSQDSFGPAANQTRDTNTTANTTANSSPATTSRSGSSLPVRTAQKPPVRAPFPTKEKTKVRSARADSALCVTRRILLPNKLSCLGCALSLASVPTEEESVLTRGMRWDVRCSHRAHPLGNVCLGRAQVTNNAVPAARASTVHRQPATTTAPRTRSRNMTSTTTLGSGTTRGASTEVTWNIDGGSIAVLVCIVVLMLCTVLYVRHAHVHRSKSRKEPNYPLARVHVLPRDELIRMNTTSLLQQQHTSTSTAPLPAYASVQDDPAEFPLREYAAITPADNNNEYGISPAHRDAGSIYANRSALRSRDAPVSLLSASQAVCNNNGGGIHSSQRVAEEGTSDAILASQDDTWYGLAIGQGSREEGLYANHNATRHTPAATAGEIYGLGTGAEDLYMNSTSRTAGTAGTATIGGATGERVVRPASLLLLPLPLPASASAPSFTVLTWNVLARANTKYNHKPPTCTQGHINPADVVETRWQKSARYALAADQIMTHMPDAVFLQEVEASFFTLAVNPKADDLLGAYGIAHQTTTKGPGTAVLLRHGGALVLPVQHDGSKAALGAGWTLSVGASAATGGTSKSGTAVLANLAGTSYSVLLVSVHLTPFKFDPSKAQNHLCMLGDALSSAPFGAADFTVVGGDFNALPAEVAELQKGSGLVGGPASSILHGLVRVDVKGDTGSNNDLSRPECIDHVMASPGLKVTNVELERPPRIPYNKQQTKGEPALIGFASDHVWQAVAFEIPAAPLQADPASSKDSSDGTTTTGQSELSCVDMYAVPQKRSSSGAPPAPWLPSSGASAPARLSQRASASTKLCTVAALASLPSAPKSRRVYMSEDSAPELPPRLSDFSIDISKSRLNSVNSLTALEEHNFVEIGLVALDVFKNTGTASSSADNGGARTQAKSASVHGHRVHPEGQSRRGGLQRSRISSLV